MINTFEMKNKLVKFSFKFVRFYLKWCIPPVLKYVYLLLQSFLKDFSFVWGLIKVILCRHLDIF